MQMDWSYVGAVVVSGLVIVFVALIVLIFAVWLMGKIFTVLKKGKKDRDKTAVSEITAVQSGGIPVKTDISGDEEEDEVIAVIAAAVAAMSEECGRPLKISSIKRSGAVQSRTNQWARAAVSERTSTF